MLFLALELCLTSRAPFQRQMEQWLLIIHYEMRRRKIFLDSLDFAFVCACVPGFCVSMLS